MHESELLCRFFTIVIGFFMALLITRDAFDDDNNGARTAGIRPAATAAGLRPARALSANKSTTELRHRHNGRDPHLPVTSIVPAPKKPTLLCKRNQLLLPREKKKKRSCKAQRGELCCEPKRHDASLRPRPPRHHQQKTQPQKRPKTRSAPHQPQPHAPAHTRAAHLAHSARAFPVSSAVRIPSPSSPSNPAS
jgi:hypothetical protein